MVVLLSSIVNFLAVLFILWFFGRKPFSNFLISRSDQVKSQIETATDSYGQAEKELQLWQTQSAKSEAHARQLMEDAKSQLERFKEEQARMESAEAERVKRDSGLLIQNETTKAKKLLEESIISETLKEVRDYLKGHVGEKEQSKLLGDYLESMKHVTS